MRSYIFRYCTAFFSFSPFFKPFMHSSLGFEPLAHSVGAARIGG